MLLAAVLLAGAPRAAAQVGDGGVADSVKRRRPVPFADMERPPAHDPVMAREGGRYYVFATGNGVSCMSSADLVHWSQERPVLSAPPAWAVEAVPGYRGHTWAPDIVRLDGVWHLYYSCSTFGRNASAIGLAVNRTLDPSAPGFGWEDRGMVIRSRPRVDDWNAIDPSVCVDGRGRAWLAFGSFWDGIQLVRLAADRQTPVGRPRTIARRRNPDAVAHGAVEANANAVEAPFIIRHGGYYYLLVSFDYCCQGLRSTYKTAVGRSRRIGGPYRDREGRKMLAGGGTVLLGETADYAGVGHCAVYEVDGQWYFLAHGYAKDRGGQSELVVRKMRFADGWPVIGD